MEAFNGSNKDLVDILRNLVQISTENPPGKTNKIIDYLIKEVFQESNGFKNEVITYKKRDIELSNLITKVGSGKEKIIFSGHFDVVPAGDIKKWKYHPFSAKIVEGKLFGRGSSDMKGGLTMLIGAMMKLKENPEFLEKCTLVFIGSADEEAGMTGAYLCARKGIMKNATMLIVGEPTNLNVGIAEKGLLWVSIDVYGKTSHSSTPHLGINSIEGSLKLIPHLYNCLVDRENKLLGKSTLNVARIKGGDTINVVPDKTTLEIDYRLIPEENLESLIKSLKNIKIPPYNLEIKITYTLPALETNSKHAFIQNLLELSKTNVIGLPYATDAAVLLQPKNPIPFVIYGPGDPAVVHKENEYIKIEHVYKAADFLTKALLQTYLKS
ncbi:MAG: M20 family metallopeptidase [Candidatus Thorarchaeota archaeon]